MRFSFFVELNIQHFHMLLKCLNLDFQLRELFFQKKKYNILTVLLVVCRGVIGVHMLSVHSVIVCGSLCVAETFCECYE